jgi:beta-xylosidase
MKTRTVVFVAMACLLFGGIWMASASTIAFTDIFSSAELADLWYWEREAASAWSLTANPGHLRIYTQLGTLYGDLSLPKNLLLTQVAPDADFQVDTRLLFRPSENFHEAGVVIYADPGNYVLLGRAFADCPAEGCVGDGVYVDYEENGVMQSDPPPVEWDGDQVYLRISKQGQHYTFFAGRDGETWSRVGELQRVTIRPIAVGLYAIGGEVDAASIPADFDYFRITPLP